ncbi:hypothetical protein BDF19DRAFT_250823 [Syncephalis fuscata]|nr:hypothetical protein BDF19DRAFT_250823 [Syncephalis fuscata]
MTDAVIKRALFGGAIEAVIPSTFSDVSQFREVPDNQEVFAATETEESIIVELLELDEDVPDNECAKFHFEQIAQHNESPETQIINLVSLTTADLPHLPSDTVGYLLAGQQQVAKFREKTSTSLNTVDIFMAVLRLRHISTEILVTVNVPVAIGSTSSSRAINQQSNNNNSSPIDANTSAMAGETHIKTLLSSFNIINWNLFQ